MSNGKKETTKERGLTEKEAAKRLRKFGENIVFKKKKFRPLVAFARKFNSPLLQILVVASIISFFIGQNINAIILLLMVLLSAILDFVNSYKSEKAVASLIAKVVTTATVIRDGVKREIEFKKIVPGDIVFLSAGDIVPADAQVIASRDFFVNQSALTGESFPVEKVAETLKKNEPLYPGKNNLVFLGTNVVTGFATVLVLRTGENTEFGHIAESLASGETKTEFEKNIQKFSVFIMWVTAILVGFVFLINAFLGRGILSSFIFSLAIAIGLTPELLPVIISVSLSRGSLLMAKKGVIVKHLPAIENFGSMDVLCTDKTGTLTEDRIVLVKYIDPFGAISDEALLYSYLNSFFHTGVTTPLDNAIQEYRHLDIRSYLKIDEIPFDAMRRRQSIVVEKNSERILITKGAPEEIMKICSYYEEQGSAVIFDKAKQSRAESQFQKLSLEGFRVLAIARKGLVGAKKTVYSKIEEQGMVFLGFVAFLDPAKSTAKKTVKELSELGIEIKIITGDNELLTEKICRDIGLEVKGVVTGDKIDKLKDRELGSLAVETTIFARINPEQKERIIQSLRQAGKVVGYLGDGINDAPALKAADVGISVNNAVDVAKETADIILLLKSLRTLRDGVVEGRRTYHNTMKYILMGLSSNFGNMFSMMGASALLPFLPMLPTQVLLNNFLYDSSQLSLATDSVDAEDVRRPSVWDLGFIKRYMLVFGLISSIFDFLTFGFLYYCFRASESQFQTGWFIESIATQVFVIYIIRTKKIPFLESKPSRTLFLNTFLAVAIAWLIPFLPLGAFFGFSPLPWNILAVIAGLVAVYLLLVEVAKRFFYRRLHRGV